jgi:DNA replication and repair protein RecF
MLLQHLVLENFRNYQKISIDFSDKCNIIFGDNAQGKTNILEAIFYLCFSRSFRTASDKETVNFEKNFCRVLGSFLLDLNVNQTVVFQFSREEGKTILIEEKKLNRYSELIGKLPIVLLSPEDYKITGGGPAERRNLMDMFLSQVSSIYLKNLQQYNRILKQRNTILSDFSRKGKYDEKILEPWNESFIETGSKIIKSRNSFITEFSPLLTECYSGLNQANELISFTYKPSFLLSAVAEIENRFRTTLHQNKAAERIRGMSLYGPHRDDFIFMISGNELRTYGSRGQHKSALVALKLAQFFYLKQKKNETPILLLDDLFSDLDPQRGKKILASIEHIGQTFITTTQKINYLDANFLRKEFHVINATISAE